MKFKLYSLALFIAIGGSAIAQDVNVTNGAPFLLDKKGETVSNVLNQNRNDFTFLTLQGKNNFRVVSLDEDLKSDLSKEIVLPEVNKKEVKFVDAKTVGERTYFFSQYYDRKEKSVTLFASDLDLKTGKFIEHYEAMKVIDDKFNMFSRPFSISQSMDSTKLLFICNYPGKRKEDAKVAVTVTDNDLNEVWKNDIVFDQENRDFSILKVLVDGNGNLHMSVQNRMDGSEKRAKGAASPFYVSIYSYFHEAKDLKEYEIGFKNEIIINANLELNENNEILCTGFYGEKKVFDAGMKGFFFIRINPDTREVVAKNLSPFDKKFLGQLMSERKAEKGKGLFGYLVRDTYPLSDGGMAVVSEYYNYTYFQDDNGAVTEYWTYGNVLVFFLDKDGEMKTYSILKKNQMCMNKSSGGAVSTNLFFYLRSRAGLTVYPGITELPYYGIGTMMKDDKVYMIYNENPKNAARVKAGKKPKSVREKKAETMLIIFDADGDISSEVLFKAVDKDLGYKMPVMPTKNFAYSKSGMLVVGKRGKNARVVDISIED